MSQSEKTLLRRYFKQMETAMKFKYASAVPSTDMRQLQEIYKLRVNPRHAVSVFCSRCAINTLAGLYDLTLKVIKNEI